MEGEQTSSAVRYGGARLSWRKYVKRLSCRNRIGETIRAAAMMKKRLRGGHAARRALLMGAPPAPSRAASASPVFYFPITIPLLQGVTEVTERTARESALSERD